MSTYTDLDSRYRETTTYPNPCSYTVTADQVRTWVKEPRQVVSNPNNSRLKNLEYAQSLEVKHLILPYSVIDYIATDGSVVTTHTADLQRMYLDVYNPQYGGNGARLINTIGDSVPKARFLLLRSNIQYDSSNSPKWVIFSCSMDQVYRFARDNPIVIQMFQETGRPLVINDTIPVTSALQTDILLEIIPYFRDADFNNQALAFV